MGTEKVEMVSEEDIKELEVKPEVEVEHVEIISNEMSNNIGDLAGALGKAQSAMSNGTKDKEGYGYSYITLENLTDIIRPHLGENGLALVQTHSIDKRNEKAPAVFVHSWLVHSSGQFIKNTLSVPITIMKQLSVAQMMGVSMTYGRRYALQSMFMIASEEDTDATIKEK